MIVVTGGAGFIGSHLVAELVGRGEAVRVLERPGASVTHLPASVDVRYADIRDDTSVRAALVGARSVYHLAADPNLWARDRDHFDAVNHRGTRHVLDAALAAGARRVVHVSTESILTRSGQVGPIDEQAAVTLDQVVGSYCRSKWRAEEYARGLARDGAPVLIANPTMPVGPGDRGLSPPSRLVRDFARGALPALIDCTLNLIDVRDVALGLVRVHDAGEPGRRHLLGAENWSLRRLLEALAPAAGAKVPRWDVPYPLALAAAHASEWWADLVSGRMPQATVTGVRLARRLMHFDPARTWERLGMQPRPVLPALGEALDWMRGLGWLGPGRATVPGIAAEAAGRKD